MANIFYAGSTSQSIDIWIADSSSSTGGGLSGLVYNSGSLTAYYRKGATGTSTAITLATQTVGGAWSSGGFVEVDATNMKGLYRFDIPNALIDTAGITHVIFCGATNMVPVKLRLDCRAVPSNLKQINSNATAAVQLALSAGVILSGTVSSAVASPTTTVFAAADIAEATADHYNGRVVLFTSGALIGQATAIVDFARVSSEGQFTVVALTEAAANGDTFIIV